MTGSFALILYALFALGGAGVYLALPGTRSLKTAAALLALPALAGLMVLLATRVVFESGLAYFIIFGSIALVATARVITHEKPVYSAVYFVLVVLAIAFLLVVQQAEFLAVALVVVYAGAILVTYVFVIMLAQQSGAPAYDRRAREPLFAVLLGFLTMATVAGRVTDLPRERASPGGRTDVARDFSPWTQASQLSSPGGRANAGVRPPSGREQEYGRPPGPEGPGYDRATSGRSTHAVAQRDFTASGAQPDSLASADMGNTVMVGRVMLTRYVIALEIAGVLLLVAMIGAIAMARKRVPADEYVPPAPEPGAAGRTVAPF